uniref:Uncharacterized protein n=1 Tax=Arundo donax TaxID=35708 RepID=A0A0A9HHE4_ARUDO
MCGNEDLCQYNKIDVIYYLRSFMFDTG